MEGWSIRQGTEDDIPTLLEIERRTHQAPWTEDGFCSELKKPYSHCLVLTDDETDLKIAAYILFWFMFEECQILNVVVDLPYRGLGFAQKLIRQAVNLALQKGILKILLEVRKSNLAAIQLYQGLGFVITHVRAGFYSDGEDAYQMALYAAGERVEF